MWNLAFFKLCTYVSKSQVPYNNGTIYDDYGGYPFMTKLIVAVIFVPIVYWCSFIFTLVLLWIRWKRFRLRRDCIWHKVTGLSRKRSCATQCLNLILHKTFRTDIFGQENMPYDKEGTVFSVPAASSLSEVFLSHVRTGCGYAPSVDTYETHNYIDCPLRG